MSSRRKRTGGEKRGRNGEGIGGGGGGGGGVGGGKGGGEAIIPSFHVFYLSLTSKYENSIRLFFLFRN